MLDLNDFRYFVEVVDRGGFSSAGRSLQRPTSTISYRIQHLERQLGLSLLTRTSRSISLTDSGARFYEHAVGMLDRAIEAEIAMRDIAGAPVGTVRYTVAVATAQFAMQDIALAFLRKHPDVQLEQNVCDNLADIVVERYDFAIRTHNDPLPDSALIQRPLATIPWHLFASPLLLAEKGIPQSPGDLADFANLYAKRDNFDPVWRLRSEADPGMTSNIPLQPRMTGACMTTLKRAAQSGMGVVALPAYICRDEVNNGSLVRVLPRWIAARSTITALMPSRRGMTAASRAFLDHIAAEFPQAVQIG
jgi:DNA-binding transcriptional LysR family regulator